MWERLKENRESGQLRRSRGGAFELPDGIRFGGGWLRAGRLGLDDVGGYMCEEDREARTLFYPNGRKYDMNSMKAIVENDARGARRSLINVLMFG